MSLTIRARATTPAIITAMPIAGRAVWSARDASLQLIAVDEAIFVRVELIEHALQSLGGFLLRELAVGVFVVRQNALDDRLGIGPRWLIGCGARGGRTIRAPGMLGPWPVVPMPGVMMTVVTVMPAMGMVAVLAMMAAVGMVSTVPAVAAIGMMPMVAPVSVVPAMAMVPTVMARYSVSKAAVPPATVSPATVAPAMMAEAVMSEAMSMAEAKSMATMMSEVMASVRTMVAKSVMAKSTVTKSRMSESPMTVTVVAKSPTPMVPERCKSVGPETVLAKRVVAETMMAEVAVMTTVSVMGR